MARPKARSRHRFQYSLKLRRLLLMELLDARQGDRHSRAAAHFALDFDRTLVAQDDALAEREPEPRARTGRLGGEERIEHALQVLARDADAVVDHLDQRAALLVGAVAG